jgi:hypothetical protein
MKQRVRDNYTRPRSYVRVMDKNDVGREKVHILAAETNVE